MKMKWRKTVNSRGGMPEYVERSYHEALVNALAHRDYLVNGSEVHIDIYDDRMEIYSPGGMPNLNYDLSQDFEENETMSEVTSKSMSESMSELERTRMQIILLYLDTNKKINSSIAAKLLNVEIKTASRLLSKAAKLDILKSYGETKNKVYFRD